MPYFKQSGASIYYEGRGEGTAVLVLHGFTEDARDLAGVTDALSERYRVIAPDMRGYGRSEPKPRVYTPQFYQEDEEEMAALLRYLGVERTHVLGFSDGGEVALLMAVLHPELVLSLVEWGAAGTLGTGELLPEFDAIYDLLDNPHPDMRGWSDYVRESYGEDVGRRMVQGWAEASKAIMASGGDISLSRAHQIKCPALLLSGELDPYATPAMTLALAARIPNATYEIVPGAGHPLHHEQAEWFVERVMGWLERETRNEKRY